MAVPLYNSVKSTPDLRLFTNSIGRAFAPVGYYFPHDEFYDAATGPTISEIARVAPQGAVVATETPGLFDFYADQMGRPDLRFVNLSDKRAMTEIRPGDIITLARGRRYRSNSGYFEYFKDQNEGTEIKLGDVPAAKVVVLDGSRAEMVRSLAAQS
jgi:hypothetical protein